MLHKRLAVDILEFTIHHSPYNLSRIQYIETTGGYAQTGCPHRDLGEHTNEML
jgi:hypothetical protein